MDRTLTLALPRLLVCAWVALFFLSACQGPSGSSGRKLSESKATGPGPEVSVEIFKDAEEVEYKNSSAFIIVSANLDGGKEEHFSISDIVVKADRIGLSVYDRNYGKLVSGASEVFFRQTAETGVGRINGKGYRGNIHISLVAKGKLRVINRLGMENYLRGVLPAEMGVRKPDELECLKSQAVAARTYALHKLRTSGGADVLESTIMDQVYVGFDEEYALANEAIETTCGEVIMYSDSLIKAYYFAVCGGKTENLENVWGADPVGHSVSIDDEDYCAWAKSYFWEDTFTRELIRQRLNSYFKRQNGQDMAGTLRDIRIIERSPSGRVMRLKILTDLYQYELRADNIRWAIRRPSDYSKILPSTLFDVNVKRDDLGNLESVRFIGRGNGHGAGMCQCGAIGRARRGQGYEEILKAYYGGVEIRKMY